MAEIVPKVDKMTSFCSKWPFSPTFMANIYKFSHVRNLLMDDYKNMTFPLNQTHICVCVEVFAKINNISLSCATPSFYVVSMCL